MSQTQEVQQETSKPNRWAAIRSKLRFAKQELPAQTIEDTPEALEAAIQRHEAWLGYGDGDKEPLRIDGATFSQGTIENIVWTDRHLDRAKLPRLNFYEADIQDTSFVDADLSYANLETVTNLQAYRLAGANLNHAKLPKDFEFKQVTVVEEMSKNCGKYFLTVLAGCAYALLTAYTTTDGGLLANNATSTLPFLQTGISIRGFYLWAPWLLLGVYVFFYLNLHALWGAMSRLPAVNPDARTIDEVTYPWLVNRLAHYYSTRLRHRRVTSDFTTFWAIILLTYWSLPVTMLIIWARALHRHDIILSTVHCIVIGLSVTLAIGFHSLARITLRRDRKIFARVKQSFFGLRPTERYAIAIAFSVLTYAALTNFTHAAMNNSSPLVRTIFRRLHYSPDANIDGQNVSMRPDKWVGKTKDDYEEISGASLSQLDMRRMSGQRAFLVHADLRGANLDKADLSYADIRDALLQPFVIDKKLSPTSLVGTDLQYAKLDYADLEGVTLKNADLFGDNLTHADLTRATITNTDLRYCNLTNADLFHATLTHANLKYAYVLGTDLSYAQGLTTAQLSGAFGDDSTKLPFDVERPSNWPHKATKPDWMK